MATLEIETKLPSTQISHDNSQWFERIIRKVKLLTNADDDWEIPFDRIRISYDDFHGCGSQGDVFYGRLGNKSIAVKRTRDVSLTKIKHLREINHENIVRFHGVSSNSNFYYIVMEWCSYGTLHEHIHNGRQISPAILSDFTIQIAKGMQYLHSKNIIHCDLKPSNILLTHNDILKISDFGTHKVLNDRLPITSTTYTGTHAYMAPEVIRSEPYSFPVDVWSYGVVLWEVLIGDEPYKKLDRSAVVWAVGNNSLKLPIPFTFPEEFSRVLEGCWKAKPEDRLTFDQICIILTDAIHKVDRIPKQHWLPLQADWKLKVRAELDKYLQPTVKTDEEKIFHQKMLALEQEREHVQRLYNKNKDLYLKLQECSMHIDREIEELSKRRGLSDQKDPHKQDPSRSCPIQSFSTKSL